MIPLELEGSHAMRQWFTLIFKGNFLSAGSHCIKNVVKLMISGKRHLENFFKNHGGKIITEAVRNIDSIPSSNPQISSL